MKYLEEIQAKSYETLTEHTLKVYKIWKNLKERYSIKISDKNFWNDSLKSILFHDFGKITNNFQDVITKKVHNYDNYLRHEFISGMFLFINAYEYYKKNPLSVFAVFSHHKKLDPDLFTRESSVRLEFPNETTKEFLNWIENYIYKTKFNLQSLEYFKHPYKKILNDYKNSVFSLIISLQNYDRIKYIHFKALLQISDWLASGNNQLPDNLNYNIDLLKKKILEKINNENKENTKIDKIELKKFQLKSNVKSNILAIAPTGSGKTEAALIWASNKEENAKIIYLLPTKVTSNAIYERLKFYFDESNTAVIHSSAFFYRKELADDYEKKDYLLDKTFFKNVSVCTIDQVLTQGFNLGYWELKTFHMLNAKVIIDEIHLYEPYTLGLIIATLSYFKKYFNTTFYIMSATMPQALRNLLTKYLDNPTIVEDNELLNHARNKFVIKENYIEESVEEIVNNAGTGKKVLVVVNTVYAAISLYQKIKNSNGSANTNILCYHSRFTLIHRREKEKEIFKLEKSKKPIILIATQVVEVSLDIDFDVLFTENAPIDALIQRAGRVNRKRKKKNTKVIVFKHSETSQKWVYKSNDILNKTWNILFKYNEKNLSEQELTELVDKTYKGIKIEADNEFIKGLKIYEDEQKRLFFICDNSVNEDTMTRLNMDTINVIPMMFYEYLVDKTKKEKAQYEISIRRSRYFTAKKEKDVDGFKYVDYKYNRDIGLIFQTTSSLSF